MREVSRALSAEAMTETLVEAVWVSCRGPVRAGEEGLPSWGPGEEEGRAEGRGVSPFLCQETVVNCSFNFKGEWSGKYRALPSTTVLPPTVGHVVLGALAFTAGSSARLHIVRKHSLLVLCSAGILMET